MNALKSRISSTVFAILSIATFSGCCIGTCEPIVKYIDKPYAVEVPVKCKTPDVNCSFNRDTDTEVISALLECIIELKKSSDVCK